MPEVNDIIFKDEGDFYFVFAYSERAQEYLKREWNGQQSNGAQRTAVMRDSVDASMAEMRSAGFNVVEG